MFKNIKNLAACGALCAQSARSWAVGAAGGNPHLAAAANPVSISYAAQILVSFLAVIGLILLLAWLLRKTGRYGAGGNQVLKIVSSTSLGMREKILLVEVEGTAIVVGVAPGQISALHVMEKRTAAEDGGVARPYKEESVFGQLMAKFAK